MDINDNDFVKVLNSSHYNGPILYLDERVAP